MVSDFEMRKEKKKEKNGVSFYFFEWKFSNGTGKESKSMSKSWLIYIVSA